MTSNLQQHKISETAVSLFLEKGYDNVHLEEIVKASGIDEKDVYKYFGSKQDVILFLYQSINADWEIYVNGISEKKLSERFEKALTKKIDLIAPHADLLNNMMGLLLRNPKVGVSSPRTRHIRMKGIRTMKNLVDGSGSKQLQKKIGNLPAMLYLVHWAVLFLHIQSNDRQKTNETIKLVCGMLKRVDNLSFLLPLFSFFKDITKWSEFLLDEKTEQPGEISRQIVNVIFNHRKISGYDENCSKTNCKQCEEKHISKIDYFVSENKPLHFILPAFPAKSPNKNKVLGEFPDLGEETALITLENMCKEIADVYPPGAKVTICSDGRIFAELVEVADEKVTAYVNALKKIISELQLKNIDVVNLEDLLTEKTFSEARKFVIENYAGLIDDLHQRLKTSEEFKQLFNGIHRFITEDRYSMETEKSKSKIKEESKLIALKVIQHSNAWTRFLSYYFPESIRLSIHPYTSHADKIGIQLTKATDNWLTPWHGVMVLGEDGYMLMKKQDAEKLNAKVVMKNGRPYYYTLISPYE